MTQELTLSTNMPRVSTMSAELGQAQCRGGVNAEGIRPEW